MKELEIRGKTVEDAINKGLKKLGVTKEKAEIKILDEGKAGLFGLMGASPAKVKLTLKEEGEEVKKEEILPELKEIQEKVKTELKGILNGLGLKAEMKSSSMAGRIYIQIKSEDSGAIIGKRGQTLEAIQHIINLMINKQEKKKIKIILDVEGYRAKREEMLVDLAEKIIKEVRETGKRKELEPMNNNERRIIHMRVKETEDIESFSKGEGIFRRVVIAPKR